MRPEGGGSRQQVRSVWCRYTVPEKREANNAALVVESWVLSRSTVLDRDGFDHIPLKHPELLAELTTAMRRVERASATWALALASVTGWADEVFDWAPTFGHPGLLLFLVDLPRSRLIYNWTDRASWEPTAWEPLADLLSPAGEVEAGKTQIDEYMGQSGTHALSRSHVTADEAMGTLKLRPSLVQKAFKEMETSGHYVIGHVHGRQALVKS